MPDQASQAKQPVSAALAGPYGHPFHPMLVTVPIGAWVASLVFDIASLIVSKPGFLAQGAEWLIAIGVLGALAAAMVGFLDMFTIPTGTPAFRTALLHMSLNLAVTVAYAINFAWRFGSSSNGDAVGAWQLVLSAISLATLAGSGYLGGKLAYRYGVRVADEGTQAEGFVKTRDRGLARHATTAVDSPTAEPSVPADLATEPSVPPDPATAGPAVPADQRTN